MFPISWERVAKIANLQECLLPLVGDVQVIYSGDSCDLERFKDIQSKLHSNLINDEYVKDIAQKRCEDANRMCEQIKLSGSLSEVRKIAGQVIMTLADAVAIYNNEVTVAKSVNAAWLAGLYEEISSTFNKIYVCCENGNYILAFLSAVCLQQELDDAQEAGSPSYDLLSYFDYRELSKLAERTRMIETDFVELITNSGGTIKSYDNWEQFVQADL